METAGTTRQLLQHSRDATIFLNDYRVPVMMAGITVNIAGVLFMARLVVIERRQAHQEESCSAP